MKSVSLFAALALSTQLAQAAPVVIARPVFVAPRPAPVVRPTAPAVSRPAVVARQSQHVEPVVAPATHFLWLNTLFNSGDRCEKTASGKCKE